jgi:tetrahydrodipicolinate N-succinyltransferase
MGFLNWGLTIAIAAACTVATSAVVIYTTQYLIRDHHTTLKKNQFKNKIKHQKSLLKSIEKEKEILPEPVLNEKSLLELDERLLQLLERLDTINVKPETDVDKKTFQWMNEHCLSLQTRKRELILQIQQAHQTIDQLMMKIKIPELLNSDDSECSESAKTL